MKKLNEQGFGALELIIIVLVITLIGLVGWLFLKNQHKTATTTASGSTTSTSSSTTASGKYAGWKTASLKYEKISYQYPADWKLTDASNASPKGTGCVYPGYDRVTLTAPSGNQVVFKTGMDCIGDDGVKTFETGSIKTLGQDAYFAFENNSIDNGDPAPTKPAFVCLAPTATPTSFIAFTSKNIFFDGEGTSPPHNSYCFYPYNPDSYTSTVPTATADEIKANTDYANALKIFESIHY